MLEFQDKLNWTNMLMYQQFSEDFLRKFIPKYDWGCWCYLSQYQNISIAFILEFADKIQWSSLSMNHHLTDEHLRKFKEKIEWGALVSLGRELSEALIIEFQECISKSESSSFTWKSILQNKKKFVLSEEFRKEILKKID